MTVETPWIINTDDLEKHLGQTDVVVIDISNKDSYTDHHIPGAIFLDYATIVQHNPPVVGMLPDAAKLSSVISEAGIKPDDYLVIYDEEGGGKAARLMWTLEITGHEKMSMLNGGIVAWLAEDKAISTENFNLAPSDYPVEYSDKSGVADADYIINTLNDDKVAVLDTRSANEYNGTDVRSARGGHIPGAINIDWVMFKDPNTQKLVEQSSMQDLLNNNGITKNKEIIVHCHSHHRSALAYVALKNLGYEKVKGYPASWSDWATRPDTPIEI